MQPPVVIGCDWLLLFVVVCDWLLLFVIGCDWLLLVVVVSGMIDGDDRIHVSDAFHKVFLEVGGCDWPVVPLHSDWPAD